MVYIVFAFVFILLAAVCYLGALLIGGDPEGRGAETARALVSLACGFAVAFLLTLGALARHSTAAAVLLGAILAALFVLAVRLYRADLVAAARRFWVALRARFTWH